MITYDEDKRLINLQKHQVDFLDAQLVFAGFTITHEDKRFDYGETRHQTLGLLGGCSCRDGNPHATGYP